MAVSEALVSNLLGERKVGHVAGGWKYLATSFWIVVKEYDFKFSLLEMLQVHLLSTFTKHEH